MYSRGSQPLGRRPAPVRSLPRTSLHKQAKSHPRMHGIRQYAEAWPLIHRKNAFHGIDLWCIKGWGLLMYRNLNTAHYIIQYAQSQATGETEIGSG